MDEHLRAARAHAEPPWDDLRERRVLERLMARVEASRKDAPLSPPRWADQRSLRIAAVAVAVLLVVAGALLIGLRLGDRNAPKTRQPSDPTPVRTGPPHTAAPKRVVIPKEAKHPSVVRFADGSSARVSPGGDLLVVDHSPARITLEQRAGRVTYRVTKNPGRRFLVRSGPVAVEVVGTVFTVTVSPDRRVHVAVEKGVVLASDASRRVRIHAGEQLVFVVAREPHPGGRGGRPRRTRKPRAEAIETLMKRVDQARRAGRLAQASLLLQRIVQTNRDHRTLTALFMLGEVELRRGQHKQAARAFARFRRLGPSHPLVEDALAGEARAWWGAGDANQAQRLAREYLRRFPGGPHARAMSDLL